jgi:hypothetical protein
LVYIINSLTPTYQIRYAGSLNGQYVSSENLVLGMNKFSLSSVSQLALNTTVTNTRNFSTDSVAIFGQSGAGSDYISM